MHPTPLEALNKRTYLLTRPTTATAGCKRCKQRLRGPMMPITAYLHPLPRPPGKWPQSANFELSVAYALRSTDVSDSRPPLRYRSQRAYLTYQRGV